MNYLRIDRHKRETQVAVVDQDSEIDREVRVFDALAEEYAGNEAAIKATGNYFTIYDTGDRQSRSQNRSRHAKKLAQLLRVDVVAESYVPPDELRKGRALARDRKIFVEKRTDYKTRSTPSSTRTGSRMT